MASAVDSHPQRQKIIDALLAGRTLRDVSQSVSPSVSVAALHRYRQGKLAPALGRAAVAIKTFGHTGLPPGDSPELEKVVSETRAQLAADPFIQRVEFLRQERERIKGKAEASADLKAWSSLDRNDLSELELHARLAGRLTEAPQNQVQINIVCPADQAPAVSATDGGVVLDIGPSR